MCLIATPIPHACFYVACCRECDVEGPSGVSTTGRCGLRRISVPVIQSQLISDGFSATQIMLSL